MSLDRFYPIVDSALWVGRLVGEGAELIQLRIKDAEPAHLRAELHHALTICRRSGAKLVVNDHWEAALDAGADWVHLGQGDLDGADFGALRARGLQIGLSTHSREELDRALSFDPDYVALGPIYPTILKAMAFAFGYGVLYTAIHPFQSCVLRSDVSPVSGIRLSKCRIIGEGIDLAKTKEIKK